MNNVPVTATLPPLSKDYRAGLDAARSKVIDWQERSYGTLTVQDLSAWLSADRLDLSADQLAGLTDGLAAYLYVVLSGDSCNFPVWHPLEEIRPGEDRDESPVTETPLINFPLEEIKRAAREAGRSAFNDIETINACWIVARSAWLDAHIPSGPGMSDDEFGVIVNEAAGAYEEGIDDRYRTLEEGVSHD